MGQAVATLDSRRTVAGADTQSLRRVALVKPTSNPKEILEAHDAIAAMVQSVLTENIDYGVIPGTDKKALLKPGAERLAFSIGASMELDIIEREIEHDRAVPWTKIKKHWTGPRNKRTCTETEQHGVSRGLYRYVVRCRLVRREDGAVLGEGIGSCSTMESKYIDRPRDSENTVLKMAKKRASVDATLSTLALSGRFAPDDVPEVDDPPRQAEPDEDGAVADPTDGLTLAQALDHSINNVQLGRMRPTALENTKAWVSGKLLDDPTDATLLRIAAMIDMVRTYRETNPLPPKVKEAAPVAATPNADGTSGSDDDDSTKLPF